MVRTHGPRRQATVEPCLRKAATKVMRPRSDRGSRCTDKDQSEETEDRALISAIKHIHVCLPRLYNSLAKPDPCFSFESLALQDYNNRASEDEPATAPC